MISFSTIGNFNFWFNQKKTLLFKYDAYLNLLDMKRIFQHFKLKEENYLLVKKAQHGKIENVAGTSSGVSKF
jgi:hypothetical protein